MPEQIPNEILNRLLIRVYRGLVQYAIDCWPWTNGSEAAEQRAIEEMARLQQRLIARLVGLLEQRGVVIDFGVYPDNSELHYVSLDYLIGKLVADEQEIVSEIEAAQGALRSDSEAAELAAELLTAEKANLASLRDIAKTLAGAAA